MIIFYHFHFSLFFGFTILTVIKKIIHLIQHPHFYLISLLMTTIINNLAPEPLFNIEKSNSIEESDKSEPKTECFFSTPTNQSTTMKSLETIPKENNDKHLGLLVEAIEKREIMREAASASDNEETDIDDFMVAHKKLYNCKCKDGYSLTWLINENARIVGCDTCMKAKLIVVFNLKFNSLAKKRNRGVLVQEHQFSLKFRKNSNVLKQIIETNDISAMLKTHVFQNFFSKYPLLIGKKMDIKRDKSNTTFQQKIAEFEHLLPFTYTELSKSKLSASSEIPNKLSIFPKQDDSNGHELKRLASKCLFL